MSTQRSASGRAENRRHKSVNRVFSVWFLEQVSCLFSVPALLRDPRGLMHAGKYGERKYHGLLHSSPWLYRENKLIGEISFVERYVSFFS